MPVSVLLLKESIYFDVIIGAIFFLHTQRYLQLRDHASV